MRARSRFLTLLACGLATIAAAFAADAAFTPVPRADENSRLAHEQLIAKAKQGKIDVYFIGDSITRRWGATDYPPFLENWKKNFYGWNAGNFGWGADSTQHILWRLQNGELEGVNPKVFVVLAGTNNVGRMPGDDAKADEIARGVRTIVDTCRQKFPSATVVLMGIFPRNDSMAVLPTIARINTQLAAYAAESKGRVRFLNINDRLANAEGVLHDGIAPDKLHVSLAGYQIWADALKPVLTELLGPPAKTDSAPPPTGDPSAGKKK